LAVEHHDFGEGAFFDGVVLCCDKGIVCKLPSQVGIAHEIHHGGIAPFIRGGIDHKGVFSIHGIFMDAPGLREYDRAPAMASIPVRPKA
jgi:hypothetical protein